MLLYKIFHLLTFLLLARARPQDVISGGSFAIGGVDDWGSAGNYLIYSCGLEATNVNIILDLTYLVLQTAILSTDGAAYKAFFRTANPNSMTAVLKAVTAGTNITTTKYGSRRPTLVCANPNDQHLHVYWNICRNSEGTVIIQPPGSPIIFLCPIFFSLKPLPEPADCGVVNHAGTRLIPQNYLARTQFGFLVHVLVDLYLQNMGKSNASGGDVRDQNSCLALPPSQALTNPSSYVLYASSKCPLLESTHSLTR